MICSNNIWLIAGGIVFRLKRLTPRKLCFLSCIHHLAYNYYEERSISTDKIF